MKINYFLLFVGLIVVAGLKHKRQPLCKRKGKVAGTVKRDSRVFVD